MKIHNIMEDMVLQLTIEIFDEKKQAEGDSFCTCHQCLNDVSCYVLNRIAPHYIFSSRGAAHFRMKYLDNLQRKADIAALIHKGIARVRRIQRPHFRHHDEKEKIDPVGHFFNFPTITGKVLNGITFEPLFGVALSLYLHTTLTKMINPNWQNPYTIISHTAGIYNFLPYSIPAKHEGEHRTFEFELVVDDNRFEPFRHYFSLDLVAEKSFLEHFRFNVYYELDNVHLVPLQGEE